MFRCTMSERTLYIPVTINSSVYLFGTFPVTEFESPLLEGTKRRDTRTLRRYYRPQGRRYTWYSTVIYFYRHLCRSSVTRSPTECRPKEYILSYMKTYKFSDTVP